MHRHITSMENSVGTSGYRGATFRNGDPISVRSVPLHFRGYRSANDAEIGDLKTGFSQRSRRIALLLECLEHALFYKMAHGIGRYDYLM